jgi:hypothetical protein
MCGWGGLSTQDCSCCFHRTVGTAYITQHIYNRGVCTGYDWHMYIIPLSIIAHPHHIYKSSRLISNTSQELMTGNGFSGFQSLNVTHLIHFCYSKFR